jgi:CheY-like chemotaxis protein
MEIRGNAMGSVLWVEDDKQLRDLIQHVLTYAGIDVKMACDGLEGIELAQEYKSELSVIILDLRLPKMDGTEVLAKLKEDPTTRDIPVIIISAWVQSGTAKYSTETLLRAGAEEVHSKPMAAYKMIEVISKYVSPESPE